MDFTNVFNGLEDSRVCGDCEGLGYRISQGFTSVNGKVYPDRKNVCDHCEGMGNQVKPDFNALLQAVTTNRGAKDGKRKFRASAPSDWQKSTQGLANRRAYYVWRMARFHGGADMTMPMMAQLFIGKDAYFKELNVFVDGIAKACFGTDLAAANRWSRALGYI